jgi:hypothetical protein
MSSFSVFSSDDLNFMNFFQDVNSDENKVSYEISLNENVMEGDIFSLKLIINDTLNYDICKKLITVNNKNVLFEKHTCIVPKSYGGGKYAFEAFLQRGTQLIERDISIVYVADKYQADLIFEEVEEGTMITINVDDLDNSDNGLKIFHDIPSEVIDYLDKKNKDDYIISERYFAIIENYPLIAWSVDKAPTKINYTIKKNISFDDRKKFNVVIEKDNYFGYLSYFIFFMILIVLYFILRTVDKKLKNTKK